MCGLMGWQFTEIPQKRLPILAGVLSALNDERGGHSWGCYAPDRGIIKELGKDYEADMDVMKGIGLLSLGLRALEMAQFQTFMGHTRYATTGKVSVTKSHPFVIGSVVGAHNGIVDNHLELNATYSRKCSVDSQHIFHHVDDGLEPSDIEAYGAVSFAVSREPEHIYLCRFNGGSLCVAQCSKGVVWSSDRGHLQTAMELAGLNYDLYRVNDGFLYCVQDGELQDTGVHWKFKEPCHKSAAYSLSGGSTVCQDDDEDDDDGINLGGTAEREQLEWETFWENQAYYDDYLETKQERYDSERSQTIT